MRTKSTCLLFVFLFVFAGFAAAQQACNMPQELRQMIGKTPVAVEVTWSGDQATRGQATTTSMEQRIRERERMRATYRSGAFGGFGRYPVSTRSRSVSSNEPLYSPSNPAFDLLGQLREKIQIRLMACSLLVTENPAQAGYAFKVVVATKQEQQQEKGFDGAELATVAYQIAWPLGYRHWNVRDGMIIGGAVAGTIEKNERNRTVVLNAVFKVEDRARGVLVSGNEVATPPVNSRELKVSRILGKHNTVVNHPNAGELSEGIAEAIFGW